MYNVYHNIYRNFLPNWIAQISVGFTLMGVFKILFQKMPWKQWWFQQKAEPEREALLAEVRDEAIVCERQTQLMRLIKNWSASDIGTVCRTLQWLLYNERWHELSWAVIVVCSFNQTGYIHTCPMSSSRYVCLCVYDTTVPPTERCICFDAISPIATMQRYEYPMLAQQGSVGEYLSHLPQRETYWFEFSPSRPD